MRSVLYFPVDGLSLIFPRVKNNKVKKNFSEKEHKLRRIAVKAPIKRPVARGNDMDIVGIISCKIRLKFTVVSETQ
jgi:hypothetical protein